MQIRNFKGIKKTFKIVGFSIAALFVLLIATVILLQNSKIQNFISSAIVKNLSETLNTKVDVDDVHYKFFNTISVNNLYVEDLQQDTLLFIRELDLNFRLIDIIKGKFVFDNIEIDGLYGNLTTDSLKTSNLDFLIKAFSRSDTTEKSNPVEFNIRRLALRNSTFSMTNQVTNEPKTPHVFNSNLFRFTDINTDILFDFVSKDSMNLHIKMLSANEQFSGFSITDLKAEVSTSPKGILAPVLKLELPHSILHFDPIVISYDSIADLKYFNKNVRVAIPIKKSNIALSDLSAFAPDLKSAKGSISLSADLSGHISNLNLQNLKVYYGKNVALEGSLQLSGLPNIDETFIYGNIASLRLNKNDVQDFISELNKRPVILPKELNELGTVRYKGNITGFFNNLVVFGNLTTNIGNINTDIQLQFSNKLTDLAYNGTLKSSSIHLGQLINNHELGKMAFSINTKGVKKSDASIQGTINANVYELQFREYAYKDINFDGKYDGNYFDGKIVFEDENLNAQFNGIIDLTQKLPVFNFMLDAKHVDLYALKLIKKYPESALCFTVSTNVVGNSLDNVNGYVRLDNLQFVNQNKTLNVDSVLLTSAIADGNTNFSIASDYVNGSFDGRFLYSTIGNTFNNILSKHLPAISIVANYPTKQPNQMNVDLKLENFNQITDVLDFPHSLQGTSTIKGYVNETDNQVNILANFPVLSINANQMENFSILLSNANRKEIELTVRTQALNKMSLINLFLNLSANDNLLNTRFGWQNTEEITNAGNIHTQTIFTKTDGLLSAHMDIQPTDVIISDSVWHVHKGGFDWNSNKSLTINNFHLESENQFIYIDGIASKNETDSLRVSMNNLNLDFIMDLVGLNSFLLGGNATGNATVFSVFSHPVYEANIQIADFKINKKHIGNAKLFSTWDRENKQVYAKGVFIDNKNDTVILADGAYIPASNSLDFVFDARDLSIKFLTPYFDAVAENVKGFATGKVRLHGPSKKLSLEGNAFVQKGEATISLLKTTYTFEDTIYLNHKRLEVKNLHLYDPENNVAIANGHLNHNGLFSDMTYDFLISAKNVMAINTQSHDNEYFYGKAYADGTVRIHGDMSETNIVANVISKPRSKVYIRMTNTSTASNNSFIKFIDKDSSPYIATKKQNNKTTKSANNVKVNLQVEVTPDAEIELIIDPKAGDMINAKGSGNLRMEFDTNSDIKLFGTYAIDNGHYLFTLQNFIRKTFRIERGSNIAWSGSLTNANVNIRAIYSLTASLRDLMDKAQLQSATTRSNVPVNCVLILTDNLMNPTIKFNIDLPSSDESVAQHVRSIINTEEMMNRQILYLLLLGRFYTPEYVTANTTNTANDGLAFATATINGWLSQLMQSSKLSIGVEIHSDDQTAQYQTEIQYRPNNRFIVNGNIGYQKDELADNRNRFIGDVDIEYLLTELGKLRFKGYSHTVDRQGTAKISYGAGFLYKEEFNSLEELFNYYFRQIWRRNSNNETKENETNNDKIKNDEE